MPALNFVLKKILIVQSYYLCYIKYPASLKKTLQINQWLQEAAEMQAYALIVYEDLIEGSISPFYVREDTQIDLARFICNSGRYRIINPVYHNISPSYLIAW